MKKNSKNRSTYIFRNRLIAGVCVVVLIILLTLLIRFAAHGSGTSQTQDEQEHISQETAESNTDAESQPDSASESSEISDIDIYDRRLVLMNANVFPANYSVNDTVVADESTGESLKQDAAKAFQEMQKAAEEEDVSMMISQGYRDPQNEEQMIRENSDTLKEQGISEDALESALREKGIFEQGDEHLLGYSADIVSADDSEKSQQDAENWLSQHAAEYGFILRYPQDKEKITGVLYQAEHYRYVGSSNAAFLQANQLCLEELYAYFMNDL